MGRRVDRSGDPTVTPVIDPDAPWWANLALIAFVFLVPTWFAFRSSQASRRAHRALEHEMKPNSGTSMKDQLNRIERGQKQQSRRLQRVERAQTSMQADLTQVKETQVELANRVTTIERRHPWWPRHH